MALILNIETATRMCSVALSSDGEVLSIRESAVRNAHAENITLFCESVLQDEGYSFDDIDAVAVSMGPGSYTGLRIGVSTAKGYCYALDKPLIAISTLQSLAYGMRSEAGIPGDRLYVPMIDARRMEVYMAVYDDQLHEVEPVRAEIIHENTFFKRLKENEIVFAGDGAPKCKSLLDSSSNALFLDDFLPSAAYMVSIAEKKFRDLQFENVAYFEPFYLKDFVAGIPKVKGLK